MLYAEVGNEAQVAGVSEFIVPSPFPVIPLVKVERPDLIVSEKVVESAVL